MRLLASLCLFVLAAPVPASTLTPSEAEVASGLMSWAVKLSSYPAPAHMPTIEFVSQDFFEKNACDGRHCKVWGWYPNTGRDVVYVHERMRPVLTDGSDPKSLLAASIVLHEFVHYLQAVNRNFAPYRCEEALDLEREAYRLQNAYILSYGRYMPVGMSMHGANCEGSASGHGTPAPAP